MQRCTACGLVIPPPRHASPSSSHHNLFALASSAALSSAGASSASAGSSHGSGSGGVGKVRSHQNLEQLVAQADALAEAALVQMAASNAQTASGSSAGSVVGWQAASDAAAGLHVPGLSFQAAIAGLPPSNASSPHQSPPHSSSGLHGGTGGGGGGGLQPVHLKPSQQ